jgi:hypothetical protein
MLDLHPSAAAIPVLAASKIAVDAIAVEAHSGGDSGDDDGQLRPVRLAGRKECEARHAGAVY